MNGKPNNHQPKNAPQAFKGQGNQNPGGKVQVNQNNGQGGIVNYPEDHLKVLNGIVCAIRSNYMFSDEAIKALRGQFRHLLVDPSGSRLYVGDKQGFENHPHPVGAFQRSYFDDLIMNLYQTKGRILEPGASPVRTYTRWCTLQDDVKGLWGDRVHMMNPDIGAQDALRRQDHQEILENAINKYNHTINYLNAGGLQTYPHDRKAVNGRIQPDDQKLPLYSYQCPHKFGDGTEHEDPSLWVRAQTKYMLDRKSWSERNPNHLPANPNDPEPLAPKKKDFDFKCTCEGTFAAIKSVESFYYPGVQLGTYSALCRAEHEGKPMKAWVVMNDYHRMLIRATKTDGEFRNKVKELCRYTIEGQGEGPILDEVSHSFTGIKTIDGTPESIHTVKINPKTHEMSMDVRVNGNPIPYLHQIPRTSDQQTWTVRGYYFCKEYRILCQVVEKFENNEVPFVLIKMQAIPEDKWTEEQKKVMPLCSMGWTTMQELFNEALEDEVIKEISERLAIKHEEYYELTPATVKEAPTEVTLKMFNEELFTKKLVEGGQKRYKIAEGKAVIESSLCLLRWLKMQIGDRNTRHQFHVKFIDGEAYLMAAKLTKAWGFFVQRTAEFTAMAKVDDVVKAYLAIGVKSNVTALQQALVQEQRTLKTPTTDVFAMNDAYIIARLVRQIEAVRSTSITQ